MGLEPITTAIGNSISGIAGQATGLVSDPVVRLGVTGLSRAGKTVFITSLVSNLLAHGRMPQFSAAAHGRIEAAYLQPQPDDTIPRFSYERHLDALLGSDPVWPQSTRGISELRLSLRLSPSGFLSGFRGPQKLHIDIVDYPGEWLLDLALLDQSYDTWSAQALSLATPRGEAAGFLKTLGDVDGAAKFRDVTAEDLAGSYAQYLKQARENGASLCTPGRFLLPGDLAGSPVLTFAPMPVGPSPRGSFRREMERRFNAYKSRVVKPFFRDHFARIDRQIVLVDVLKALALGPDAVADLERAMAGVLSAFRTGRNGVLNEILLGKRVEKILFAATKADHVHHSQHPQLTGLMAGLVQAAREKARFSGAQTQAVSLAALRATVEADFKAGSDVVQGVKGVAAETGRVVGFFPGDLPQSASGVLAQARAGDAAWDFGEIGLQKFKAPKLELGPSQGVPHIRLDKALQFLLGDKV